jgi:hypothetical protein
VGDTKELIELVNREPQRFRFLSPSKLRVDFERVSPLVDLAAIERMIGAFIFPEAGYATSQTPTGLTLKHHKQSGEGAQG